MDNEMLEEYDFSEMKGMERGKYYKRYREGHTVRVLRSDGTVKEEQYVSGDAVVLDPEVRHYFPDSDAVNRALRGLIQLIPQSASAE